MECRREKEQGRFRGAKSGGSGIESGFTTVEGPAWGPAGVKIFSTIVFVITLTAVLCSGAFFFAAQVCGQTDSATGSKQTALINSSSDTPGEPQGITQKGPGEASPAQGEREILQPKESPAEEHKELSSHKKESADALLKPFGSREHFVETMAKERGEDPAFLNQRYERALALIHNDDLYREKETRAFLMTPREKFCRKWNLKRAYEHAFLDIGYGVTISGPHLVGRMTSALDVQPGDKVLEIGTGSGYQSAILSNLTDQVFTIEIIEKLAHQTDKLYTEVAASGYPEYGKIKRKADDGYYGWEEYAPFDKIIVTCGIDHIPPPLLKQLSVGGSMVIPVGPPGAQVVLKVTKTKDEDGNFVISREDIYHGRRKVPFVPFTKKGGGTHFK